MSGLEHGGRRRAILAAAALMLLVAAGCGGGDGSSSSGGEAANKPQQGFEDQGGGSGDKKQLTAGPKSATATFSVGSGMAVTVTGGGGGTSNCTKDETADSFTTKGNNERHDFGYYAKGSDSCAFQRSWSYFKVLVKNSKGDRVGSGDMWFGQDGLYGPFFVTCGPEDSFAGINCEVTGDRYFGHDLKISS